LNKENEKLREDIALKSKEYIEKMNDESNQLNEARSYKK